MALPKVAPLKPDTYHGVDTLEMHVGDAIPAPRAPIRYAVRVSPDLARYLLTFNHERNRMLRKRLVQKYVSDMRDGLWQFTPAPVVFSRGGTLEDGQHRLAAVAESGEIVWLMVDFGWPDEIIHAIDRGAARTSQDSLRIEGVANAATIAAAIVRVQFYEQTVGHWRSWSGLVAPSSSRIVQLFNEDVEGWETAGRVGGSVYAHLDKGLSSTLWATAFRVINAAHPDEATPFFDAVANGTDEAGSVTRRLADLYRRKPATVTRTGDIREPMENIVRAFNARKTGKLTFVARPGFTLSRVK